MSPEKWLQKQGQQNVQGQQGAIGNVNLKSVRLTSLDQNDLKGVQTQLKDLGFYKGNVDGMLGNQTKTALLSFFQSQINLARQGKISDQALTGFGFDKSQIEKVRGIDESKGNVREPTRGQESPSNQNNQNLNNQNRMQQQQPTQQQPSQQQQQQRGGQQYNP